MISAISQEVITTPKEVVTNKNKNEGKVVFAQILRGYAALIVCINHLFLVYWNDKNYVGALIYDKSFTFGLVGNNFLHSLSNGIFETTKFAPGYFGVALFFLISGFVIPFSLEKRNFCKFMMNRIFRIFPTLIFSLSLVSGVLFLCSTFIHTNNYQFNFTKYINNILLVRPYAKQDFIDPVTWTLEIELLFYLIVGAFASIFSLKNKYSVLEICSFLTVSALILAHSSNDILLFFAHSLFYLSFMFMGSLFYNLYKKNYNLLTFSRLSLSIFFLLGIQLAFSFDKHSEILAGNYIFAYLVFSTAYYFNYKIKENIISKFLSRISYSLYVSHQVIGYLIISYLITYFKVPPFLACSFSFCIILFLANFINKWIELPSTKFSKKF